MSDVQSEIEGLWVDLVRKKGDTETPDIWCNWQCLIDESSNIDNYFMMIIMKNTTDGNNIVMYL